MAIRLRSIDRTDRGRSRLDAALGISYRYPVLQSYDGEMSYPADLMIRLPDQRSQITGPEMRTVLRSIYFKHYLRWDRPFLDATRFGERERLINQLYSSQVEKIS